MKLQFIKAEGTFSSHSIKFQGQGSLYDVPKEVGEELLRDFGVYFNLIEPDRKQNDSKLNDSKLNDKPSYNKKKEESHED
jgi:hypothetical protein